MPTPAIVFAAVSGAAAISPGVASAELASGAVIGDVLFERVELMTEVVDAPLEQVADGKNPEQFAVVVGYGQMTEVALEHGGESLTGPGARRVAISTEAVINSRTGVV